MSQSATGSAFLTYDYGTKSGVATSNIADITSEECVKVNKSSLMSSYFLKDNIVYNVSVINNSKIPISKIKIQENLGTYKLDDSPKYVTPLDFSGSFQYYVNGIKDTLSNPKIYSDKIIFNVESIPACSNISIFYTTVVNKNASLSLESHIKNTSTVTFGLSEKIIEASTDIPVKDNADIKIIKQIKSTSIIPDSALAYELLIYNYGNTKATNVKIKDTSLPITSGIKISVNSEQLSPIDYSYSSGSLKIPSYGSDYQISVPAATFIQDKISGKFDIKPGITKILVEGNI